MASADFYGLTQGESLVVIGPPGTGKSTFLGSVCNVVPPERVALLITKPREASSFLYRKHNLEPEIFYDRGWRPELGRYEATGYMKLVHRIEELYEDDSKDAVLLDVGTDAINLLEHHLLSASQVSSPGDLGDSFGFYRQLKDGAQGLVDGLVGLTIPGVASSPKFVLVAWHAQPAKEEQPTKQKGVTKAHADKEAQGVEYEGKVLPMIEGGYRRKLAGDFSIVVYSDLRSEFNPKTKKMEDSYVVQVKADKDRHAKVAPMPAFEEEVLPNDFGELHQRMVAALEGS